MVNTICNYGNQKSYTKYTFTNHEAVYLWKKSAILFNCNNGHKVIRENMYALSIQGFLVPIAISQLLNVAEFYVNYYISQPLQE